MYSTTASSSWDLVRQTRSAITSRRRRALTAVCAVALALVLGGCDEGFCKQTPTDDLDALKQGLLCFGANFPDRSRPGSRFTMEPTVVDSGGTVRLDASRSTDPSGIAKYEWDLDGELGFELDAGTDAVIEPEFTYRPPNEDLQPGPDPERRVIRLRVTGVQGTVTDDFAFLTIRDPGGLRAVLSVRPNPARVGQTVVFDGSASNGAVDYEWDLDGDGIVERGPAPLSLVEFRYPTAGTRRVALRVTDGVRALDTAIVDVVVTEARTAAARAATAAIAARGAAPRAASAARAVAAVRGRRFTARLIGVRFPDDLGRPRGRGSRTTFRGVVARGRLVAPGRGLGPLRRFRRARWVARLDVTTDVATRSARVRGHALARFPNGAGRACLRLELATRPRGAPRGQVTLLGGRGAAARLRGGGRFRFRFRGTTPSPDGRLGVRLDRPRPLPRACSGL